MRCDLLTLFPAAVEAYLSVGVVGQAAASGVLDLRVHDLRRWAINRYGQVDDEPFGGGPGMVLMASVVCPAVRELREGGPAHVVLPAPRGRRFRDAVARELAAHERLILVCGRYEGFDERVHDLLSADEISIGDYVVAGGELPALTILEATARYVPGVVGDPDSVAQDSFATGVLDHPVYTRPREYESRLVPEVLLTGNHRAIGVWRRREALRLTLHRRPDLIASSWAKFDHETRRILHELADESGITLPSEAS